MSNPAVLALAAAAQQVAQPMLDLSPLIPALNLMLVALATVATAAVPVLTTYAVQWLRQHRISVSVEAQMKLGELADKVIQKGFDYAAVTGDNYITALQVPTGNPTVAKAANYVITQIPDAMKSLGFDPSTPAGQEAIVRMVTARLIPAPPAPSATLAVTVERAAEPALTDALRAAEGKP